MVKRVCDCCGKSHYNMGIDKRLKEKFGIEVDICLDCFAWLDDNDRYDRLLENGIINDEMFNALITEK